MTSRPSSSTIAAWTCSLKRSTVGISKATKSTPVAIRPDMKWALRASRSSLAMTSLPLTRFVASMASAWRGRAPHLPAPSTQSWPESISSSRQAHHRCREFPDSVSLRDFLSSKSSLLKLPPSRQSLPHALVHPLHPLHHPRFSSACLCAILTVCMIRLTI